MLQTKRKMDYVRPFEQVLQGGNLILRIRQHILILSGYRRNWRKINMKNNFKFDGLYSA